MASRLGRWCRPVGKWEKTCRPDSKGLLADSDNSFWSKPPLNVDGHIAQNTPEKSSKPAKPAKTEDENVSWAERLLANYHG